MIILDTHVLLWWLDGDKRLSPKVKKRINSHKKTNEIFFSSMTFWEVAMLLKKNRLQLKFDVTTWVQKVSLLPFINLVPPDHLILVDSVNLPEPFHADPADRIIVATARHLGVSLITKDQKIRDYPHVQTFWEE